MYPSYLIHFNRQHDPKTGKFTYGDGDGDGIRNDHKNQDKSSLDRSARRTETYRTKPNRNLTRDGGTGKLVRVGDTNAGSKLLLDQSNREKTTYRQALTRDGGTGKLVRVGDTKVGNYVKGKRQKNPNGDKPGEQSDGTKSKDTYVKLPGQPISRVKNTYEKIPDGPYKPKYKKVQTQLTSKDEEISTEKKYNTHRLNAVSNFIDDVINSDKDENKKPGTKKPMSNSEKVSAEEKGRKFVLKTIDRMLNKLI